MSKLFFYPSLEQAVIVGFCTSRMANLTQNLLTNSTPQELLTSDGRTLVQGALAWIWGQSERTIPIPGFKTVKQVEENALAMQFGPLNIEQISEIDALLG
jgi:aryl-alcohol dehydrogenase-like predicted oxidoreductase